MTKHNVTKMTGNISLSDKDMWSEAAVQRCFVKKMFLKILQKSEERPCSRISFLKVFLKLSFFKEHI